MGEWKKKWWLPKKRVNPKDDLHYVIASDIITFTTKVLQQYDPHEGIVYWAGSKKGNTCFVTMAIAPTAITHEGQFIVDHLSNARAILALHEYARSHLGQVHSHPGTCVDHSGPDDREAAFKTEGLLSLVVPCYGRQGMDPLLQCGIHRFKKKTFVRLGNKYIKSHFRIISSEGSVLIDLRNKKEYR